MRSLLIAGVISLGLARSWAMACPKESCKHCGGKHTLSSQLQLDPERKAKLEALEAEFQQEHQALKEAHKAKLANLLTAEELAKVESAYGKPGAPKTCPDGPAKDPAKSPF